jgi:ketosteroid isomerase-like protein
VRRGDMSADKNIELVQAGYAAFSTGDMATLNDLFAAAAVWHVPGSGVMSGPKQGRDAILAYFGEIMARSNGTFTVSLLDIAGSDERVYALQHIHAEREGRVIDYDAVNVFHVSGGVATEVAEYFPEGDASDAFWA